ncbi:MAG: tetratricopeptide repeat protein [Verrucomicrobia bacterium]|nr:tetratricopeptide repeat protein [Verrucomicrobiota bacterium]MCH8525767.1 tetratricopeptide repeat protein [Kiritimatiellia bacterium]
MKFLPLLLLVFPLWAQQLQPEPTRAQQERLNRILTRAENDPRAALEEALDIPIPDRDPQLWRWIGDTRAANENWSAAINAYEAALKELPTYRDVLINLTQAALADDQPARAMPFIQAALQRDIKDPRLYEALAVIAEASDDLLLAENAYRQAILLDAEALSPREGLARTLIAQQRFAEADPLVRTLLKRNPSRAGLWRLYADLAQSRQEYEVAIQRLETAVRLNRAEETDLKRLIELYMVLDRPLEVLRIYRANPGLKDDPPFRLRLAEGLLGLGHTDPARELLTDLPEPLPTSADQLRFTRVQAQLLLLEDKASEAAALLETALREAPLDIDLLRLTGEAWLQADRPLNAVPHFERLARQSGQEARGLWYQGIALARAGEIPRAIELLEGARRIEDLPGLRQTLEQLRRMSER